MPIKSSVRAFLNVARNGVRQLLPSSSGIYRPDLSDREFLASLLPVTDALERAKAASAQGDQEEARRHVVDHFVLRTSPRFFVTRQQIPRLAILIRNTRSSWIEKLRARVETDLSSGLKVMSARAAPLRDGFDWTDLPRLFADDKLFSVQPHRFGFMPRLALAEHHGIPTCDVIGRVLDRWIAVTREGNQLSYLSPLVALYRVIALSWLFELLAALDRPGDVSRSDIMFSILKIACADMRYLHTRIGKSYPNNHLLADGFAGWYCGTLYPEFDGSAAGRQVGEAIFLRELERQFLADGTNIEHSTHYHELGCEMAVAYVLLSMRNGSVPNRDVVDLLSRMLAFQTSLNGPRAISLAIGDATEDPLFPLDAEHGWGGGAMLELHRLLFDPGVLPPLATDATVERAWWLLGGDSAQPLEPEKSSRPLPVAFEQGGFYVFRDVLQRSDLVFRSGPTENAPISAGHAHADVLSLYLGVEDIPLIVDAGTFSYRRNARGPAPIRGGWRSYFAGPQSHNGLIWANDPYGEMSGDFRDKDVPCRVRCTRHSAVQGLEWREFEVIGDNAASGHRRGVVFVQGEYWVIYDLPARNPGTKGTSIGLQFAPGTCIERANDGEITARLEHVGCVISLSDGYGEPQILEGSTAPPGGWVSPAYGEIVAAPQLRARIALGSGCGFVLHAVGGGLEPARMVTSTITAALIGFRIVKGCNEDTLLIALSPDAGELRAPGIEHSGSLIWLRRIENGRDEVRRVGHGDVRHHGSVR